MRITRVMAIFVAIVASAFGVWGLDAVKASRTANTVQDRDPMKPLQHVVASKTAKFGTVDKDDAAYKDALDAHDLAGTLKLVGKEGSFRGTVSKFFEERDGDLIVFDFDPNYRTAITAVLKGSVLERTKPRQPLSSHTSHRSVTRLTFAMPSRICESAAMASIRMFCAIDRPVGAHTQKTLSLLHLSSLSCRQPWSTTCAFRQAHAAPLRVPETPLAHK